MQKDQNSPSNDVFGNMKPILEGLAEKSENDAMSVPPHQMRLPDQVLKSGYDFREEQPKDSMRAHQLSSKIVDLTHDVLPETQWRPIKKTYEKVPPAQFLTGDDTKILLKEWEAV